MKGIYYVKIELSVYLKVFYFLFKFILGLVFLVWKILNKFEIKEGCEDNEMVKEENFKSKLKNLFGIKERINVVLFYCL